MGGNTQTMNTNLIGWGLIRKHLIRSSNPHSNLLQSQAELMACNRFLAEAGSRKETPSKELLISAQICVSTVLRDIDKILNPAPKQGENSL